MGIGISGSCEQCDWFYLGTGYPEVTKAYQDHLRDEHPEVWLRR
ncbi:hypothetical protein [Halobaculum lipolyticum]|uniref:Uncharacterized protein n=1 Tax=Halobaculum lipolyticum TaxID=3032001 RepID=A0ABD5W8P6_9EURY|nr:hypothetical protein [Halobaculum sp. DT31]